MRIGFFTDSYLPRLDGAAINIESFRAGLESLGHEVFVFCPKRPEKFTEPSKRIYRFPSWPGIIYEQHRDTFPFMPKHIRDVSALKLDIVHTFSYMQIGLFGVHIAKKNNIPLVTTCSADFDLVGDYKRFSIALAGVVMCTMIAMQKLMSKKELRTFINPSYPLKKWINRNARISAAFYNNQCDLVIVPSLKTKKALIGYMKNQSVILESGIDLSLVPQSSVAKTFRKNYNIAPEEVLFVSASRLVREKRIDFLIRAYALFPSEEKEKSKLVIIGDGPELNSLKKLVVSLNLNSKVIFVGRVEHKRVLEIINECDVYTHTSLRETQGLVLNEAAACGKPLIMIDRDVNPILQEGKNGFFAKDDVLDFSQKMLKFLFNKKLRDKFGLESKKLSKNSDEKIASKRLADLYKSVIKKKRANKN